MAIEFNVSEKTIQRDIDDLGAYFAETHFSETEVYGNGIQMRLRSQGDWIKNIDL